MKKNNCLELEVFPMKWLCGLLLLFFPFHLTSATPVVTSATTSIIIQPGMTTIDISALGITSLASIWSNRPDYLTIESLSPDGSMLTVQTTDKGVGFASISYYVWETYGSFGVAISMTPGQAPGLPTYLAFGSRSVINIGEVVDPSWWQTGGQTENTGLRWCDTIDFYMQGGPAGWVYQNSDWDKKWYPGKYLDNFVLGCKRLGKIPVIVYYCMVPSGKDDGPGLDLRMLGNLDYMGCYYNRGIRTLRNNLWYLTKDDNWPVLVVLEPDFMGYMTANIIANPTATSIPCLKATASDCDGNSYTPQITSPTSSAYPASGTACSPYATDTTNYTSEALTSIRFPNTIYGYITSVPAILKSPFTGIVYPGATTTPNAQWRSNIKVGWMLNLWSSPPKGVAGNTYKPTGSAFAGNETTPRGICNWTAGVGEGTAPNDFATIKGYLLGEATAIGNLYTQFGVLEDTDFVAIDRFGADGAAIDVKKGTQTLVIAAQDPANSTWFWNADMCNNYLTFIQGVQKGLTAVAGHAVPIFIWQTPAGHINTSQATNPLTGMQYPPLTDSAPGSFEDATTTFVFGDTFNPSLTTGGPKRLAFFKQNLYSDPQVSSSGNLVTWGPHVKQFADLGVFCISNTPGLGANFCTYAVSFFRVGPYDGYFWINSLQNYYSGTLPGAMGMTPVPTIPP